MEQTSPGHGKAEERLPLQFVAVCRHAERSDDMGALLHGMPWCLTEDSKHWPYDPPLSDTGLVEAEELGVRLHRVAGELDADLHVVITSPYLRCVQTAACGLQKLWKGHEATHRQLSRRNLWALHYGRRARESGAAISAER